jgi:MFS family permease
MSEFKARKQNKPGFFYGYVIVIAIFITMVFAAGINFAFGVFFNPVRTEFGWTSAMTAGAFSLSVIIQGLMGIVMGGLTDRLGPRLVMTVSGIILGLGYFLMSQISNLWQLYIYYGVIIGLGTSSGYVTPLSTVARWFNIKRNLMTGIVLIGMSLGTLVAPIVSERLIITYSWRTSYIISAIALFIVVVAAAQFLKRDPSTVKQEPDGKIIEVQSESLNTAGYSLKEAIIKKQFWLFAGAELCFGVILFSILVHIVSHSTSVGLSPAAASFVLAALGLFGILGRIVLGNVGDRLGNKIVYIIGFILMAIALIWLVFTREAWQLYAFSAIFGFAFAGMETSESPMTAWLFGLKSHGLVFGTIILSFTIGAAVGPLMTGYIFDVTGGYQLAFGILAAVGIIGLSLTAFLKSLVTKNN